MKYHYHIYVGNKLVLSSAYRKEFDGYPSNDTAQSIAKGAAEENRLKNYTIKIEPNILY